MAPTRIPAVALLAVATLALGACAPSADSAGPTAREAVRAITTAESAAGGRAFELDTEDGEWEVHVAVGDREVDVRVSADGSTATVSEDDDGLDVDDREALQAATTTLADAVRIAGAQNRGGDRIDGASLEREDGVAVWEIEFDDGSPVRVSGADGAIR
ncbi:PepSY domain-containing protein [Microbacterium sp. NPDC090007]|uniref:PepSY domain-containing protein n=1 Tax=Microbacterium sp. NPDC090007 TaxID=3364204 RepID=UPI00381BE7F3